MCLGFPMLARDLTRGLIFSCYINPPRKMTPSATEVNGLTDEFLEAIGTSFTEAVSLWERWISNIKIVYGEHLPIWLIAHNGNAFDVPIFVENEFMNNTGAYTPLFTAVRILLNILKIYY
eukprot:GHVU01075030.1.p1 GENE.GHVU01075030.1~~GHVU01075030.1.p1  ORF type:complete len:120 (-),score=4.25 GHVU01075030.1:406-765(-)